MVYAAIDIHKRVLQATVLDSDSGRFEDERFDGREALVDWAMRWQGKLAAVAIEATTGWRWVARELQAAGLDVRLADPVRARALRGRGRRPKTDRLDARWLARLLAAGMLPESWLAPAEIQQLRDRTRLRKALADDRNRWAQRLHALLAHEGWPCARARLLTGKGRRWVAALALSPSARAQAETYLQLIELLEQQLRQVELELSRFARSDARCRALERIFGVGPILACHLLAELGEASRFRRARQAVRLSGLDPVVSDSGERSRRGHLAKQGPPALRWALVQAAKHSRREASPEHGLYEAVKDRSDAQRATLTVARTLVRRAYQTLRELEQPRAA